MRIIFIVRINLFYRLSFDKAKIFTTEIKDEHNEF